MGVEKDCKHNFILMDNLGELYIACSKCWQRYDEGKYDILIKQLRYEIQLQKEIIKRLKKELGVKFGIQE